MMIFANLRLKLHLGAHVLGHGAARGLVQRPQRGAEPAVRVRLWRPRSCDNLLIDQTGCDTKNRNENRMNGLAVSGHNYAVHAVTGTASYPGMFKTKGCQ